MYQNYFGLSEAPFSIAPDPRYLYMSERHQEALAHLLYGVNGGGGFVLLTGDVGAGKTTICRCLLDQIPADCDVAYIFNPKLTVAELLSSICVEFGIGYPAGNSSIKVFVDHINTYLLSAHAQGRHTVLIIDEAQNLSAEVLEQMRLLTNLETNQRKLLQIILLGQSELTVMLARPELRQLAQRIIARYHLGPLSKHEIAAYVRHRLDISGTQRNLFPDELMGTLYRLSGGVPRVINVLCDRALLGIYVQGKERVDRGTLKQAAREVFHSPATPRMNVLHTLPAVLLACTGLAVMLNQSSDLVPLTQNTPVAQKPPQKMAVPAGSPIPLGVLEWPAAVAFSRSKELAYTALFRLWGADYQGGDECLQAKNMGLRCRSSRGGLDELRQLDRPAVLRMNDNKGQMFYATLTGLDARSATFSFGRETRVIALGALAQQWSGQYMQLWRMPPVTKQKIRLGDRGTDVEWVSNALAKIQGKKVDAGKVSVFDDAIVRQVKQFQLDQGLAPDGTVGEQTLLRLSGRVDSLAPKLLSRQAGQ